MQSTTSDSIGSVVGFILSLPLFFAAWVGLYRIFTNKRVDTSTFPSLAIGGYIILFRTLLSPFKQRDSNRGSELQDKKSPAIIPSETIEKGVPSPPKKQSDSLVAPHCPVHKVAMVMRKGPYGHFYGCTKFPRCRITRKLPPSKSNTQVEN